MICKLKCPIPTIEEKYCVVGQLKGWESTLKGIFRTSTYHRLCYVTHTNKKDDIDKGNLKELSLEMDSIVLSTKETM